MTRTRYSRESPLDVLAGTIRDVESRILDRHHEGQPLLCRGQVEAVSHLLKMHGNIIRDFLSPEMSHLATNVWLTELDIHGRALEQSLRWVLTHCVPGASMSGDLWATIDKEAMNLLLWAHDYVKLCNDHIAASRGLLIASCDDTRREIRFSFKNELDVTMLTSQFASWPRHTDSFLKTVPIGELAHLFRCWTGGLDLSNVGDPHLLPPFQHSPEAPEMASIRQWARTVILPELDDSEGLGGFSLGQLRNFWACLFTECHLMTELERRVDQVVGPENEFGSVMYQATGEYLAEYFQPSCGVDKSSLLEIIDFLTFDPTSGKSIITNSPFVTTGCRTVSLLCWRIVSADPNIMVASGLAKRSRRRVYEAVVGRIEKCNLSQIAFALRRAGFCVLCEPRLVGANERRIRPDLIIYEVAAKRILVCDYKHALPPVGAGEVDNRLRDLEEWTTQVRAYVHFIRSNQSLLVSALAHDGIAEVDGMLLFRWPMAIPGALQADITCADWASLSDEIRQARRPTIQGLLQFYRSPRDADQIPRQWHVGEQSVAVGSWVYKRPLIVAESAATTSAI